MMISERDTFFPPFFSRKDDMSEICRNGDTNTRVIAFTHENREICSCFRGKIFLRMCVCVRDIRYFFKSYVASFRLYVYNSEEKCMHTASNKTTRKTSIIFLRTYKAKLKIVPSVPPSARLVRK